MIESQREDETTAGGAFLTPAHEEMGLDMRDILSFSVPGSDTIHELQLGVTLIRFTEFDLGYFREQCVGYYNKSEPDKYLDKAAHLREYLHRCHPYCRAKLRSDFEYITLDCIIDDICLKEGVGLEELWVKNMSAQDGLGKAIFKRITEYKTGRAINQWTNLVRLQTYAASKMAFIYGDTEDAAIHKARKLYYDLAFSRTAAELGFTDDDLPKAEVCSVPFLPQSGAVMKTAVNALTPVVKAMAGEAEPRTTPKGGDCIRDLAAGLVLNLMTDLRPPEADDINLMARKYGALPGAVYRPAGFKAILDIEFDQMLEKGFYIRFDGQTRVRLKYPRKDQLREKPAAGAAKTEEPAAAEPAPRKPSQVIEKGPVSGLQTPVLPEMKPPELEELIAALRYPAGKPLIGVRPTTRTRRRAAAKAAAENTAAAERRVIKGSGDAGVRAEAGETGKVKKIISMAEDPKREPSRKRSLQEVNMRCNLIWTSMNVRTGWSITAEDASEWSRYLTKLRYGIGTGELEPAALDKFLDATLEVFKLLPDENEENE